jgi:hypothetical protein
MVSPDLMFQYSWDCVRDLRIRVLNASLLTNVAVTSPLSRVIVQPIAPWQLRAQWAGPTLDIDGARVTLSADVSGGVRDVLNGLNLTMRGKVSAMCHTTLALAADGLPVATLTAPSPLELDLADLELTYAGGDSPVSWLDAAAEQALIRPTLGEQLMAPLADLPLNYLPASVDRLLKADGQTASGWAVSIDPDTETLTLARLQAGNAAANVPALLPADHPANIAVGISEAGLNAVLRRLCLHGPTGSHPSTQGSQLRWTDATATLTGPAIRIIGHLTQASTTTAIDTTLMCSITDRGRLQIRLIDPGLPRESARAVVNTVTTLVHDLFSTNRAQDESALLQLFHVPGTHVRATAPMVDLAVDGGCLIARYAVPPTNQALELAIDDAKPHPVIDQHVIPRQSAPGAPVIAHLVATLPRSPEPPYDFVWHTNDQTLPVTRHEGTTTITRIPPPPSAPGPTQQTASLATVNVKVIDMLGRVGEAQVDVRYHPAQKRRPDNQHPERPEGSATGGANRGRGRLALGAALIALILAGGVAGISLSSSRTTMGGPPTTPTGVVSGAATPPTPTHSSAPATTPTSTDSSGSATTPTITASVSAVNGTYTGPCPPPSDATTYQAVISVSSGPTTVHLRWTTSNGGDTDPSEQTLSFPVTGPQQQTVTHNESFYLPGQTVTDWIAVDLISPVSAQSNHATFTLTCQTTLTATASATAAPPAYTGSICPHTFTFTGTINVPAGPVTVRYQWIRSDGATAPEQTVQFTGTGPQQQTVTTTWTLSANGTNWQAVQILSPNATQSNHATFTLTCITPG